MCELPWSSRENQDPRTHVDSGTPELRVAVEPAASRSHLLPTAAE